MKSDIKRHFIHGERGIHYRRGGSGPPLIVIHASPGSSYTMEPVIQQFSPHFTVFAPDTPGAGESDPLPIERPGIEDYAAALDETLGALGLDRVAILGGHTGAKIALELAYRHPKRVSKLVLNGLSLYTDAERDEMLANYFVSPLPEPDGTHLIRVWNMLRDMAMYWPWYNRTEVTRNPPPAAETLQPKFIDFFRSADYRKAYRAAIVYDGHEALARVSVPTLLTGAPTDPLYQHISRIRSKPDNVRLGEIQRGPEQRRQLFESMIEFLTIS